MKRKKSSPKKLLQIIQDISDKDLLSKNLVSLITKDIVLWTKWEEVVGEGMAKNATPHKFVNNVLTLKVSNSAWIQQLTYIKLDLINKLNQSLSLNIKDIIFKIGLEVTKGSEKRKSPPTLKDEELLFVEENIKVINDPEIRNSFKKLMISSLLQKRATNER